MNFKCSKCKEKFYSKAGLMVHNCPKEFEK